MKDRKKDGAWDLIIFFLQTINGSVDVGKLEDKAMDSMWVELRWSMVRTWVCPMSLVFTVIIKHNMTNLLLMV